LIDRFLTPGGPAIDGKGCGGMDVSIERCAGLDVYRDTVVATVRHPGPGGGRRLQKRTFAVRDGDRLYVVVAKSKLR